MSREPDWDRSHPTCWVWRHYRLTAVDVLGKQKWQLWHDNNRLRTFLDPEQALAFAVERERSDAWTND